MNSPHPPPVPVVLDVDTGVDDALALLLAATHPALDLKAVTCAAGNVSLAQVVDNTLGVLAIAGRADVPVGAGAEGPLVGRPRDASHIHGANGLGDITLPAHGRAPVAVHAVELLRQTLEESSEPLTIIALAPLTNIALLLRMYPSSREKIARIVFMGGAIGTGNITAVAEFNVWADPEAAAVVLDSGVPTLMYGLEPFYAATCDQDAIDALVASSQPAAHLAAALLGYLTAGRGEEGRVPGGHAPLGDAGTVCAVIDPTILTVVDAPVDVALAPGRTRGQTIVDLRRSPVGTAGTPASVGVVAAVDVARCRDLFVGTLS
ncbi:nucleoside hydrolase [Microbacterium sp. SSW1-59]|uniref:nucleoside hydrolase n=1 Tax=Microbacterium xanthum TaxID=3079794 RepID=UPI002AD1F5C6|nr:nucleoside hydrolase [Microbacterium sp. SSW1-59]MDZ8201193.1 nucleoside hydrolase [Microbacterium sp. SSW1-59]